MTIKTVPIAISTDSGVAVMRIVESAPRSAFDAPTAEQHQFQLSEDGETYSRIVTDEIVAAEIAKTRLRGSAWRRISEKDIPADRTFRKAWKVDFTIDADKAAEEIARKRKRTAT